MNIRKLVNGTMAAAMAASMSAMPALAAVRTTDSVIDPAIAPTLDIHKIIENDGGNYEANGFEDGTNGVEPESRIRVNDIGFSYKKVADIVNITGKDDKNNTQVGVFYTNVDEGFLTQLGLSKNDALKITVGGTQGDYFTTEMLEDAMHSYVIGTTHEEDMNNWVKANGTTGYTGKNKTSDGNTKDGVLPVANAAQGLYIVAETDISAHDGIAGITDAVVTAASANSRTLADTSGADGSEGTVTVDTITGRIFDDRNGGANLTQDALKRDDNNDGTNDKHTYVEGERYQESGVQNVEYPVLAIKAAPFLVSLPTTNTATITDGSVEKAPGTVWQYDVDVYPKNQTTQIAKRIVDPDEGNGKYNEAGTAGDASTAKAGESSTLRTHEDFQIGDTIKEVIWADAASLQPNYLNDKDDQADNQEGSPENAADSSTANGASNTDAAANDKRTVRKYNSHEMFIISDTMTQGLTLDKVTHVQLVSKDAAYGQNKADNAANYGSYVPTNINQFGKVLEELVPGTDYVITDYIGANAADSTKAIQGTEITGSDHQTVKDEIKNEDPTAENAKGHAFSVELTEAGLAKLNLYSVNPINDEHAAQDANTTYNAAHTNYRKPQEVQVVVYFDATLNKAAKLGESDENQNFPTLTWLNSNQATVNKINGNEVYAYTYQLTVQKNGTDDASKVKFIIGRTDNGDLSQSTEKDLSNYAVGKVASTAAAGEKIEDGVKWVKESNGVYHVFDAHKDKEADVEKTVINGVTYYTVTPYHGADAAESTTSNSASSKSKKTEAMKEGTLILKGFDSNKNNFKEVQTEDENNLLKSTFDVTFMAPDDAALSKRNGTLIEDKTVVTIAGESATLNLDTDNKGKASVIVNNYDAIDLRTGGQGRMMIYLSGALMVGALTAAAYVSKRRENA